jgi:hypothetical protein
MVEYTQNKQGDTIEIHTDMTLNHSYFDCICEDHYIKPVSQVQCDDCNYTVDDCSSSRENEVQRFIYKTM